VSPRAVGLLYVIAAAFVWSGTALWVKIIQLPPGQLAFIRAAVPSLLVGGYLIYKRSDFNFLRDRIAALSGLVNGLRLLVWTGGMQFMDVSGGIVLTYTSPIFSALLSYLFLGESLKKSTFVAFFIGIIGVVCVTGGHVSGFLGSVLIITAAILWGVVNVCSKHSLKKFSSIEMVFSQNFFATIFLAYAPIVYPTPGLYELGLGTLYGLITGTIGFVLYMRGLKFMSVAEASVVTYLEVVFAMVLANLLLGEQPDATRIIGGILIIVSGALIGFGTNSRISKDAPTKPKLAA
jgi:drug/metabolite transporter (DMT)-like permease